MRSTVWKISKFSDPCALMPSEVLHEFFMIQLRKVNSNPAVPICSGNMLLTNFYRDFY